MSDQDRVDKEIEVINKKLRSGYGKASLRRVGGSLYLRATYPPKPGETEPKQRELPLKLKATVTNLRMALEKSIAISTDLALERFSCSDFLPTAIELAAATAAPVVVAEWVALQKLSTLIAMNKLPTISTTGWRTMVILTENYLKTNHCRSSC